MKKEYIKPAMTQVMTTDTQLVCWSGDITGGVGGAVGIRRRGNWPTDDEDDEYFF